MRSPAPIALATALLCLSCKTQKASPADSGQASSSSTPSSSASAGPATEPARRQLAERAAIDAGALAKPRKEILAALLSARKQIAQHQAAAAIEALQKVRPSDPNGSVLGLALADALLESGDAKGAEHFALAAAAAALGNPDLVGKAAQTRSRARGARHDVPLADAGAAQASVTKSPGPDSTAACSALVETVRAGNVSLERGDPGGTWSDVHCAPEYTLALEDKGLSRVTALRLEGNVANGESHARHALAWVALETAHGMDLYGPVAESVTPLSPELTNDFVVDLQRIDVLPGGSPEIVVKIDDLATYADVAANEILKSEQSRAFLLTVDRGAAEGSREFVLTSRVMREALNGADHATLPGFKRATDLGKVADYQMKVAWGGPNSITLSKAGGSAAPRDEGALQLFR